MKTPKKNGLEFYVTWVDRPNATKQYRWRIRKKGRIIAASTEGYSRLKGAENNVKSISRELRFESYINNAIADFKSKKKR